MDKNYFELRLKINPEMEDLIAEIFFDNFDCEGVVLAEETYKDLEMISTTEGTLKIFLKDDDSTFEDMKYDIENVLDLYCGTGTIGQIVAPKAKKVIGIELIEEAVEAAKENAKLNGLNNCEFLAGDVAEIVKTIKDKPDIIILDPPRSGVHPKALEYVIKFNAKEIIYVSCNPKTLVNDLKVLLSEGYKIIKTRVKDMFPNTPHAETVVKLIKE